MTALPIYSCIPHPLASHAQDGKTLLMMAVQRERVDIVEVLLENRADVYAKNEVFLLNNMAGVTARV